MAMAPAAPRPPKELTVVHEADTCKLLLFEGAEPAALASALAGRFKLGAGTFYLTLAGDTRVVPLSSVLPERLTLELHVSAEAGQAPCPIATPEPQFVRPPEPPLVHPPAASSMDDPFLDERARDRAQTGEVPFLQARNRTQTTDTMMSMVSVEMEAIVDKFDRMTRLTTELANERTLLAWVRTGLAACRTEFVFYGAAAAEAMFGGFATISRLTVLLIVVVASLEGTLRYDRIKKVLRMPVPPEHFGRFSLRWFNVIILLFTVLLVCGILVHW